MVGSTEGFELPVVISALLIDLGQGWELRSSGLWAEQICEQPFKHWSYGLEAFALAIDSPDELVRRAHGHRVPLGWELDFVSTSTPVESDGDGVLQIGSAEGIVLSAEGEIPIEGSAVRGFWSEPPPSHSDIASLTHSDRANDAWTSTESHVILPTMTGPWVVG